MKQLIVPARSRTSMAAAVTALRAGNLVVFPTETSYGLAADPLNPAAVRSLFRLKGRQTGKALPFIAASSRQIRRVAQLDTVIARRVKPYWPGPFTVVLPVRRSFRSLALGGKRTVAIRVTSHPWTRQLAKLFGGPIIATSANLTGQPAAYSLRAARRSLAIKAKQLGIQLLWVDGGRLPRRPASTIVEWKRGRWVVHRAGAMKLDKAEFTL